MASEFIARIRALKGHHVPDLPWRQAQVLTLQAMGFGDSEVAATLEISIATAQGLAYAARRAVVPAGYASDDGELRTLHADRRNSTAWAWVHRTCCTATAFSAMQIQEPAAATRVSELSMRRFPPLDGELSLVAGLTACGLADDEIAHAMSVSTATVHRRQKAIADTFAIDGMAVDVSGATAAAWLHGECCGALPAEVSAIARGAPIALAHDTSRPAQHASIAAFLRRARLAPLIAAMWIGASMGAAIGKKRRTVLHERPAIAALIDDEAAHTSSISP